MRRDCKRDSDPRRRRAVPAWCRRLAKGLDDGLELGQADLGRGSERAELVDAGNPVEADGEPERPLVRPLVVEDLPDSPVIPENGWASRNVGDPASTRPDVPEAREHHRAVGAGPARDTELLVDDRVACLRAPKNAEAE